MKRIIIFLLCLMPMLLKAQQTNVDSLVNILNTKKLNITETLDLYDKISMFYARNDLEKGIEYAKKGLSLAEKEKNKKMESAFFRNLGIIYFYQSVYDTSQDYLNKALLLALEIDDKPLKMKIYVDFGNLYFHQQNHQTALEYYLKGLSLDDNQPNRTTAVILVNVGSIHRTLKNPDRAISFYEQALDIAEQLKLSDVKMAVYNGLGGTYADKGEPDKAIEYLQEALSISREIGNKFFEMAGLVSLSAQLTVKKEYKKALGYSHEALRISEEIGSTRDMCNTLSVMSEIYLNMKNYKECTVIGLKAWVVDSVSYETAGPTALTLSVAYIHLGEKNKAEYFVRKYYDIAVEGNNKSLHEKLSEMEVKYETEKKEIRIAALEKDKKLYLGLGIAVVFALLSAIGLLFYRHRSATQKRMLVEQKIKQLEQEKELAVAQSALKAEKAERDLIARDLHDSVGTLLTVVKNNMKLYSNSEFKETDYFEKAFNVLGKSITDLRRVVYHVKSFILNREGFVTALDEFCCSIPTVEFQFRGLNRRFDSDKEYILFNCACELINNALKHSEASQIDVHLNIDEGTVYLSVVDNGCGFDPQTVTWGIGIENIRSNLSVFDGRLDIYSEPDKGTEINIEMDA